jgi:hypothetical protein
LQPLPYLLPVAAAFLMNGFQIPHLQIADDGFCPLLDSFADVFE